jgi:hypothetical protein
VSARHVRALLMLRSRVFATESVPVLKLFEDAGKLKTVHALPRRFSARRSRVCRPTARSRLMKCSHPFPSILMR